MLAPSQVLHTTPGPYHQYTLTLVMEGFRWFDIDPEELQKVTAKKICVEYTIGIPQPRVTDKLTQVNFPSDVWPRLSYTGPRLIVSDSIHGLTRNRVRLHQQGRVTDPWSCECPRQVLLRPAVSDVEHLYPSCVLVSASWL